MKCFGKKKKCFFSVIMASYNAEKYIEEAIQSVLDQTFEDWQLVVVDDASTDNTYAVALRYENVDQRIRVFKLEKNRGPGYARNFAVEHSVGKWLAILDADDLFLPNKLRIQYDFITSSRDNLVLIGTDAIHISAQGQQLKNYSYPIRSDKLKRNLYKQLKFPSHSSIVYAASTFKTLGGFNNLFQRSQDYDLWLRFSECGNFASIKSPLIKYRVHSEGITVNPTTLGYSQYMYAVAANIFWKLRQQGLSDFSREKNYVDEMMKIISEEYRGSIYEASNHLLEQIKKSIKSRKWFDVVSLSAKNPKILIKLVANKISLLSFREKIFKIMKYKYVNTCKK